MPVDIWDGCINAVKEDRFFVRMHERGSEGPYPPEFEFECELQAIPDSARKLVAEGRYVTIEVDSAKGHMAFRFCEDVWTADQLAEADKKASELYGELNKLKWH